jgi:hypothetical protein
MRADFYREGQADRVIGSAEWDGDIRIDADDEKVRAILGRVFRPLPVVLEDASLRTAGTSGPVVLQPAGVRWFRAAAQTRAAEEGLGVRLVPRMTRGRGWDPAGAYRTFAADDDRRARSRRPEVAGDPGG